MLPAWPSDATLFFVRLANRTVLWSCIVRSLGIASPSAGNNPAEEQHDIQLSFTSSARGIGHAFVFRSAC